MSNDHIHPIFQGILAAIAPASEASNNRPTSNNLPASNNSPKKLSEASAEQWGERFMGSQAFQEGQDAALLGQALNPYRRALRAIADYDSAEDTLAALAKQWEDGYVSASKAR